MGVYIKGMKMPKECGECPLYSSIDDVCQFDQTDTYYDKKRPLWCPLVEVREPHEKLVEFIDVATFEDEDSGTEEVNLGEVFAAYLKMRESKPIIEAEGD